MRQYLHRFKGLTPVFSSMANMTYLDGIILEYCEYSHLDWERKTSEKTLSLSPDEATEQLKSLTSFLSTNSALPPEKTPEHAQI